MGILFIMKTLNRINQAKRGFQVFIFQRYYLVREELLTSLASWPVVAFVCCNMCHNYLTVLKLSMTKITMMTMMLIVTIDKVDMDHLL